MTNRPTDTRAEKELGKFLDKRLYPSIIDRYKHAGYAWTRETSKAEQLAGIDGVFKSPKQQFVIDEKATLYYINENIPTFAFELNSYQNGCLTEGWLFSDESKTTHYMLVWPEAKTSDLNTITASDFTGGSYALISRKKIISFLAEAGCTKEVLSRQGKEIRQKKKFGKTPIKGSNDRFYFYLSYPNQYEEEPLNIVIRKEELLKLASLDGSLS